MITLLALACASRTGSSNHPNGNITGVAALTFETGPKRLAILHEALPSANPIAVLVNQRAGSVVGRQVKDLEATAPPLKQCERSTLAGS